MIIIRINGGLGNQLFQYAAGRRLAYKHNTILKLDITELVNSYGNHIYGLKNFNIKEYYSTVTDIIRFFPRLGLERIISKIPGFNLINYFFDNVTGYKTGSFMRRYNNYNPGSKEVVDLVEGRILSQRFFHFDAEVLEAPDNVYMTGSFISEKYFKDIREIILEEFVFKPEQSDEDIKMNEMICGSESVSIHIRRGDVVEESSYQTTHNFITSQYYKTCVEYIADNLKNPHFFVFSDDMNWVKSNFTIPFPTYYLDHNYDGIDYRVNSGIDFQDMRLMSQCKHNIITNSTFSWWGAWLNRNDEKIVCAPKEFVRLWNFDNKDIIPNIWKIFSV